MIRKSWKIIKGSGENEYSQLQDYLFSNDIALSVYRLRVLGVQCIAILGEEDIPSILENIDVSMQEHEHYDLPTEVWTALKTRRDAALKLGPQVERHYRPGLVVDTKGEDNDTPMA